jgi:ferredoxin
MRARAVRDLSKCTKDCLCLYVCPTGATDTEDGKIDADKCIGCRQCVDACSSHAMSLVPRNYPPQHRKEQDVRCAMYELAKSKLRQEQIAKALYEESTDESEKTFLKGIAMGNRLMAEDLMREGGYLLPQSNNVKALLSYLQDCDFPEEKNQLNKNFLRHQTGKLLNLLQNVPLC